MSDDKLRMAGRLMLIRERVAVRYGGTLTRKGLICFDDLCALLEIVDMLIRERDEARRQLAERTAIWPS